MKQYPLIDSRNAGDLLSEIANKAKTYTPEWKFDRNELDGGGAIATLFAQMFSETIDRLNRMPYKNYLEFLNLLDVSVKSVTASAGVAQFELADGADRHILVPKNTQLFCDLQGAKPDDGDSRVIFETQSDFHAVPAKITVVFNVNPQLDRIEKAEPQERPAVFFYPSEDRNIQRHRFAVACDDALSLRSPSDIMLRFENSALRYRNEEFTARFADGGFASWSYFDGKAFKPFSKVYQQDGLLHLIKDNSDPLCARELSAGEDIYDRKWIFCDLTKTGNPDDIRMDSVRVGAAYLYNDRAGMHIPPDAVYSNDVALEPEGGFCFGSQLLPYDSLYISSDEVFSKRGALVNLEFQLKTVVREVGTPPNGPLYDFKGKFIVEKMPDQVITPDNVYISRLIWEYWNGAGWAHLKVEGGQNPFDGKEELLTRGLSFICPADMQKSTQNSIESYWIRARIIEVENPFSLYGRLLLPYMEALSLDFSYHGALPTAEKVYTENNCEIAIAEMAGDPIPVTLFSSQKDSACAVYLGFDRQPDGYPLSLYFKTEGQTGEKRLLKFEYYAVDPGKTGKWKELKVNDMTGGLSEDGIISVFSPPDYKKGVFFAHEGYFIRIVDTRPSEKVNPRNCPVVANIRENVIDIVQRQTVSGELFGAGLFETGKVIKLQNRPVQSCECWINEFSDISNTEQAELLEKHQNLVKIEKNSSGHISEFWVKWEQKEDFSASDAFSRHYVLDSYNGRILFGDGQNGKIPSAAEAPNIRVNYSYGGGRRGNLPAGAITGLVNSIPFVEGATNPEPTCGGSDRHNIETLERIGPQKLRHRSRAVTASDYENIVLEQFPEVKDVRCISNYDRSGRPASGYVTLVVMPYDIENSRYSLRLCRRIEQALTTGLVSCEMLSGGHFAVVPAVVMKIDVTAAITVDDYEFAAQAEKNTIEALNQLLSAGRHSFKIGELPTRSDIFNCLRYVDHVAGVNEILLEGRYYEGNQLKNVPLDAHLSLKYAAAANGSHTISI